MRFIVFGAGAIGGVVGARLFEHGHEVLLVARGAHARAIRERGLRVESPDGSTTLAVPVVEHPSEIAFREREDVVLLATKSQDTRDALDALAASAPPGIAVACLQNGVENERLALRRFANVYAVCVWCPTAHLEPGVVQVYSAPIAGIFDLGRCPEGVDGTARALAGALSASGFSSEAKADILRWKYSKLLTNLGNGIEAACGPGARVGRAYELARQEGIACLRAAGIEFASTEEDAARRGDLVRIRPIAGQRRGGGSTWQSLARGTGTVEADYLNGEIVLLGRLHGVPTPVNECLQRLAERLARDRVPPGSIPPDELLGLLDEGADPA